MRRAIWRALARSLRRRRPGRPRRAVPASRDLRDRRRRVHRRPGDHPGPLRWHLRDRRSRLDRAAELLRRPGSGDRRAGRLGSRRQGAGLRAHRRAGGRADHRDRPRDRAGANRRLGRYRRQRGHPARRDGREGRHRRRGRGRDQDVAPFSVVAGVPARFAAPPRPALRRSGPRDHRRRDHRGDRRRRPDRLDDDRSAAASAAPGRIVVFDDLSRGTPRQHRSGPRRSPGHAGRGRHPRSRGGGAA